MSSKFFYASGVSGFFGLFYTHGEASTRLCCFLRSHCSSGMVLHYYFRFPIGDGGATFYVVNSLLCDIPRFLWAFGWRGL